MLSLPGRPFLRILALGAGLDAIGFGSFSGDFSFTETAVDEGALVEIQGANLLTLASQPVLSGERLVGSVLPDETYSLAAWPTGRTLPAPTRQSPGWVSCCPGVTRTRVGRGTRPPD